MRSIGRPVETTGELIASCVGSVDDPAVRARLQEATNDIIDAAVDYDAAGERAEFYMLNHATAVDAIITSSEMGEIYKYSLTARRGAARAIYDRIRSGAGGWCPLCAVRRVSTVDHYLPKSRFRALTLVPTNLVPCCEACNYRKRASFPGSAETQMIHPYFDTVENDRWLIADVIEGIPPALRFNVRPPNHWSQTDSARVRHHFSKLALGELYAAHSSQEISGIRRHLAQLHQRSGSDGVQFYLADIGESWRQVYVNSWQVACYQSLSESEWFCDVGIFYLE